MNNNLNNGNIDLKNNYKHIVFDYIGGSVVGATFTTKSTRNSSSETKSKHIFRLTGRGGNESVIIFLFFIFFGLIFNVIDFLGGFEEYFSFIKNINMPLYSIFIEPMRLFDLKFFIFILVILLVLIRKKLIYKKIEPKGSSLNIYSRELPSNLRPAHMRLLLNDGLIDEVSLGSTIVDLIDKGYLEYYKDRPEDDKLNFFHSKDSKLIKTNKSHDNLLKYEKYIIDWFIDGYGNGLEVSATEVNNGLKTKLENGNMEPADMFYEWRALVLMSFPIDKYYIRYGGIKYNKVYSILGLIGFCTLFTYIGAILLVYCFGLLFMVNPKRVLNKTGVDEICEWLSLKRFLKDFGNMKDKTAEMVKIWDFYLTYSIALELSNKATDEIVNFFGDNILIGSIDVYNVQNIRADISTISYNSTINNNNQNKIKLFEQLKIEIEEEYKKL